ncbi:MAG TPA: efflux transporter outer membrane subunit [Stellaceae bacterium]|nr:efflux transporter outer membrane subunit [Stellaceae bacterium]
MTRSLKFLVPAVLALGSCTVGPDFTPPTGPTESALTPDHAAESGAGDQHFAVGQKIAGDWWTLFHNDPLNATLEQAIAGNRTIVAARATLAASEESVAQAEAGLFPQLDLSAGPLRQHINGAPFGLKKIPAQFPPYSSIYHVGATVSYALDIWGGTRRSIESNEALAQFQDYELDAAYLTLTGNAVLEALTIAALHAETATVDSIIADDETNLRLVNTEVRAGVATQLDIETAQSQLATDRTLLPPLRQQRDAARHALAVLVGRAPGDWSPPDFDLDTLALPAELPLSLPSDLARQRPDILASEAQLHSANATIGVATAQLYPNITLTGSLTQQAVTIDTLFHGASDVWTIGAGLAYPLFHGGALEAQKRRAVDNFNAALATYEQTVLTSFQQVADALDALEHDAEQLAEQQRALSAAEASLDLTRRAYTLGSVGIVQVLDAQRQLEQARLGFVRARAQRYLDTAQLFVSLGGAWWDWRAKDAPPPQSAAVIPAAAH